MSGFLRRTISFFKVLVASTLLLSIFCSLQPAPAQDALRDRLKKRFAQSGSSLNRNNSLGQNSFESVQIAGLNVAVWRPRQVQGRVPLVVFSHGFHGRNTQSISIMNALSDAGYLVMAPNHQDAMNNLMGMTKPDASFRDAALWDDTTFHNRGQDIAKLLAGLKKDPVWGSQIDWSKVALAGHSLGGYTVLAVAGGWNSWKLLGIKAVLALSPYCQPLSLKGELGKLGIPVMYQTGTRDVGVAPFLKGPNGAYSKTSAPAYLVEFDQCGHFAWSNFNRNSKEQNAINYYCVSFLDKYLKNKPQARPELKVPGVNSLQVK